MSEVIGPDILCDLDEMGPRLAQGETFRPQDISIVMTLAAEEIRRLRCLKGHNAKPSPESADRLAAIRADRLAFDEAVYTTLHIFGTATTERIIKAVPGRHRFEKVLRALDRLERDGRVKAHRDGIWSDLTWECIQ